MHQFKGEWDAIPTFNQFVASVVNPFRSKMSEVLSTLVSGKNGSGMPTSDKFSGRVELSHFILGGLPDVNHSRPYFRPGGCDSGRCAHRHESGVVLAPLGSGLRSVLTQSGRRLPGACRRGPAS